MLSLAPSYSVEDPLSAYDNHTNAFMLSSHGPSVDAYGQGDPEAYSRVLGSLQEKGPDGADGNKLSSNNGTVGGYGSEDSGFPNGGSLYGDDRYSEYSISYGCGNASTDDLLPSNPLFEVQGPYDNDYRRGELDESTYSRGAITPSLHDAMSRFKGHIGARLRLYNGRKRTQSKGKGNTFALGKGARSRKFQSSLGAGSCQTSKASGRSGLSRLVDRFTARPSKPTHDTTSFRSAISMLRSKEAESVRTRRSIRPKLRHVLNRAKKGVVFNWNRLPKLKRRTENAQAKSTLAALAVEILKELFYIEEPQKCRCTEPMKALMKEDLLDRVMMYYQKWWMTIKVELAGSGIVEEDADDMQILSLAWIDAFQEQSDEGKQCQCTGKSRCLITDTSAKSGAWYSMLLWS